MFVVLSLFSFWLNPHMQRWMESIVERNPRTPFSAVNWYDSCFSGINQNGGGKSKTRAATKLLQDVSIESDGVWTVGFGDWKSTVRVGGAAVARGRWFREETVVEVVVACFESRSSEISWGKYGGERRGWFAVMPEVEIKEIGGRLWIHNGWWKRVDGKWMFGKLSVRMLARRIWTIGRGFRRWCWGWVWRGGVRIVWKLERKRC